MPPRLPLPPPRPPLRSRRSSQPPALGQSLAAPCRRSSLPSLSALGDRYQVEGVLGRSRGLLLRASHTGFRQRVAIRVVSPALMNVRAVQQFVREMRILAALESEHAARIHDVGVLPGGAIYLVREYVEGATLEELTRTRLLPLQQALELFLQACEAVAEVHSRGVVLRDLQPSHAFVSHRRNGEPRLTLTDFGTCKVMRQGGPAGPGDGEGSCTQILGLSHAASPELIAGRDVDQRGDIWSLGCMLYQLLTGRPAFAHEGAALMLAIARQQPAPPSQLRPGLPHELDRLVSCALRKDRDERPQSVFCLVRPLRELVSARGLVLIEQIARLAGEEPTAVSALASHPGRADEADPPLVMVRSLVPSSPGLVPSSPGPSRARSSSPQMPSLPPSRSAGPRGLTAERPSDPGAVTQQLPSHLPGSAPGSLPLGASALSPPTPLPSTRRPPQPWESSPATRRRLGPLVVAGTLGVLAMAAAAILLVELDASGPLAHAAHARVSWTLAAAEQQRAELVDVAAHRVAAARTEAARPRVEPRTQRPKGRPLAAPVVVAVPKISRPAQRAEPPRSPFLTPVDDLTATRDAKRRKRKRSKRRR